MIVSRPCRTCRLRKKACDKTRPKCKACSNSGRQCEGYESHVKGVFVNLDTGSTNTPMKTLITKATLSARQVSTSNSESKRKFDHNCSDEISILSTHLLDLSPGEFQDHFATLWSHFQKEYARTPSDWSIQVSGLALHHKALDLALISLATMRLSVCGQSDTYRIFSLTAYNGGLKIFQRLLQENGQESKGLLVVISLIFTLFEAAQLEPTQVYDGWEGHLKGALFLMQRQGPSAFQTGGLHAAFIKLREMAMLFAFSTKSRSFLAQHDWIEIPWARMEKSSRDRLYDIATEMTIINSRMDGNELDIIQRCQNLFDRLVAWRQKWLEDDHPGLLISCQGDHEEPCGCFPPRSISSLCDEFSYMTAEYVAFLLMVTHIAITAAKNSKIGPGDENHTAAGYPYIDTHRRRASRLRMSLQKILTLPCFGQALSGTPGITEGRCRSLFPTWVLSQDPDGQGSDNVDWWSDLSGRVNYGMKCCRHN